MEKLNERKFLKKEISKTRYFEEPIENNESKPINVPNEISQNFDGEIIKVESVEKPFKNWRHKYQKQKNFKSKNHEDAPQIDPEALKKHSRGEGLNDTGIKTNFFKNKFKRKEIYYEFAKEQAARTDLLLKEEEGFIEADDNEHTADYTQEDILSNVDITTAAKGFSLNLDFGPYRMKYTKNGRHLLLGGRKGHVAAFDWVTKKLHCEMNVMEEVVDVSWLHLETMFAVAQKEWVYFYDKKGTELHCVKKINRVNRMEFLPYHFLLATANDDGYLSWLDVSIGEIVANYNSRLGRVKTMCQNPTNGVLCIGKSTGVVSMWAPSQKKPLAKMLCHYNGITAISVDPTGLYMATGSLDRTIKIWDVRELNGPLFSYKLRSPASEIDLSQKGLMSLAMGNVCEIYKKPSAANLNTPYLRHRCSGNVSGMKFCPYEDILGVSTSAGFTSLLVPGSGEPNFDAREANPFMTKSQRREYEVHALLEKIPMEFITLNPNKVTEVDVPTLKDKIEAKTKIIFSKPPNINFEPRRKMKGKGGSAQRAKNKQIVKGERKIEHKKQLKKVQDQIIREHTEKDFIPLESTNELSVLDRFKPKKKK